MLGATVRAKYRQPSPLATPLHRDRRLDSIGHWAALVPRRGRSRPRVRHPRWCRCPRVDLRYGPGAADVGAFVVLAAELGLDASRFEQDMLSEEVGSEVASQARVCANADARGTPSFFVGGDLVMGTRGYEALAKAVASERLERG